MAAKSEAVEIMSAAEMKPLLKLSRHRPVSCVIAVTKNKQGVILLHRRTKPRKLMAELRRQATAAGMELNTTSIRFGRATVDGASDSAMMRFTVNKPAPGAIRMALLEQLRPAGFQRCEIAVDEALETETEDGEDADDEADPHATAQDGSSQSSAMSTETVPLATAAAASVEADGSARPADSAASRPTVPGGDGTGLNGRPAATLTASLLNLARQIVPVIAADPSRKASLVKLATDAQASIKAGDTQAAVAGIKALREALRSPAVPDGSTSAAGHGPAPRSTPLSGSQARHEPEAPQAQLDAGAMMQGMENARAVDPADSVQLAQLAMPGFPLPLPLPPDAMPRILTPGMERGLGQAMNRAGRRMGHVGEEIARGDLGGAAGHAFLGRPFPREVDDPARPGTGPHVLHSESAKPAADEAPSETSAPGGAAPGTAGGTQAMPPLPVNPDDLLAQGWTETSHPAAAARGRRTFADPETGRTTEFDKGRPGENGFRARDHYHVPNPDATGRRDAYLDKDGRPVPDGSTPSHIYPN